MVVARPGWKSDKETIVSDSGDAAFVPLWGATAGIAFVVVFVVRFVAFLDTPEGIQT